MRISRALMPGGIDFPQWRRTITDLYALARWLPDYAEAFRLLPRVIEREGPGVR